MAKPKTTPAPTAAAAAAPEAKAPESNNKSKAIRDYAAAHPELRPTEVAKALKEQGIDVNSARVSSVLRQSSPKLDMDKIKSAAVFVKRYKGKISEAKSAIQSVGEFIDECGSAKTALAALESFEQVAAAVG